MVVENECGDQPMADSWCAQDARCHLTAAVLLRDRVQNRPTTDNECRGPVGCNGMLASAPSKHGAQSSDAQKVMVVVL